MDLRTGSYPSYSFPAISQLLRFLILGILILSTIYFINQIKLAKIFPIKTVRVYGINHVSQQEIQSLLLPLVDRGFFTVNVEFIRDRLLQIPWVANIAVRRAWPDQIEITVTERRALAQWNNQGLLSATGELFTPSLETYPKKLPQFIGPLGQQMTMLQHFKRINRLLAPLHATIASLELTPYLTWNVKLDNGITLKIGHKDILTRLDHFVKVYPKIVGNRAAAVEYIDLRYPNGMAVRWKLAA